MAARIVALALIAGAIAAPAAHADDADPTVAQTAAVALERRSAVSLQGGWWSAEAEWRTRLGVYGAVGVPWVGLPLVIMNGATWAVPVTARVGYDFPLSPRWSLRASAHAAMLGSNQKGKCGCADADPTWKGFGFVEAGVRYQSPSGFVAGLNVPVLWWDFPHRAFPPPSSLAFSQLYVGHSWGR